MRYIIETEDSEGIIGIQLNRWEKEKKLRIIEKAEPLIIIKENLEKEIQELYKSMKDVLVEALELLRKIGYNREVMITYLKDQTNLGKGTLVSVLDAQEDFFKKIGVGK